MGAERTFNFKISKLNPTIKRIEETSLLGEKTKYSKPTNKIQQMK